MFVELKMNKYLPCNMWHPWLLRDKCTTINNFSNDLALIFCKKVYFISKYNFFNRVVIFKAIDPNYRLL